MRGHPLGAAKRAGRAIFRMTRAAAMAVRQGLVSASGRNRKAPQELRG